MSDEEKELKLSVPDKIKKWIDTHPEYSASGLLRKAVRLEKDKERIYWEKKREPEKTIV